MIKDIKSVCKGAAFSHEMEIQFDSTGGAEFNLSNDAKMLYDLLFNRANISKENGYIEADGTIRLYFTYVGKIRIPLSKPEPLATTKKPA